MTSLFPVASGTTLLTDTITFAASTMFTYLYIVIPLVIVVGALVWAYILVRSRFGGKRSLRNVH